MKIIKRKSIITYRYITKSDADAEKFAPSAIITEPTYPRMHIYGCEVSLTARKYSYNPISETAITAAVTTHSGDSNTIIKSGTPHIAVISLFFSEESIGQVPFIQT